MKHIKKFFNAVYFPCILLAVTIISAMLFYSMRFTWVFVNNTVKMSGFAFGVLLVMIVNALADAVFIYLKIYSVKIQNKLIYTQKAYSVALLISSVITLISFIIASVYTVTIGIKESSYVTRLYFEKELFYAAFFILVPFSVLFLPKLNKKNRQVITSLILVLVSVIGIFTLFPVIPYKITSEPSVFDNGSEYSIVFSTNQKGTGYIEYTYEGKDYKVYDESDGRLNCDSLIHKIRVPYEHLRNNSYSVGSVHIIEDYSYGSRYGKEVHSQEYSFNYKNSENQTYLVVSDWHTELTTAYDAIKNMGEYDAVILMGDSSPGVDFEEEVVRNIVIFSGEISNGTKPVIYTRGNHETRGSYASKLCDSLGLNKFYYTVNSGKYSFVVLDSGEDKEDAHPEYGGLVDYRTGRTEMIEWLKTQKIENDKVIALSHSWKISDVEEDLSRIGWNELDRLGARLMISGHTHECRLIGENYDSEKEIFSAHPNIIGYMDGGLTEDCYVASKLSLSPENFSIEAYDNYGEKVFDETFNW